MHKLLARQIEKLKRKGFSKEEIQEEILKIVSDSYHNFDNQLIMKDRSIKLMSDEMTEFNRRTRKEDQALITTIMNDMVDAVLTLSASGEIVTVNKAAIATLGMAESELVSQKFVSLCTEYNDFQLLLSNYKSYHAPGPEKQFGIILKNAKRQKIFCEITISPLNQNKTFSYVAIIRDVTEEEQSKLELLSTTKILHRKEEELKLLSLVASKTSNAVIIMNANSQIEWVNAGFTKIFGYKIGEIIGKKPREILQGPESDPETLKKILAHTSQAKGFNAEVINYHKNGTKKWLKLVINPVFDDDGKLTNFIAIETDITDNKIIQKELEESKEKAERASNAKAQFLSTMSHEIRTPMNAVIGMSNLLLDEKLTDKQREYLNTLKFSSDNLLNLINDILDFSKIEAGRVEFENIEFNLRHLINGIKESNSYMAMEKGIAMKMKWQNNLPEVLIGDPTRLAQILNNLTGNAVKFTESGGVTINTTLVAEKKDSFVIQFDVVDTGIGISEKNLDTIFDSFTQSDIFVTRKYGGTGLGLTITKQLVDLQKGKIAVSSHIGEGSTFSVQLRFGKPKSKIISKSTTSQGGENLENIRILLVEDNQINQFVAVKFLDKWKCQYDIAENGEIALDYLSQSSYDLILMDLQMPVMDGYDATREIRNEQSKYYRDIPIIALTAGSILEVQNEAFEIGMNDFITKPFNPDELYAKIKKHLKADQLSD